MGGGGGGGGDSETTVRYAGYVESAHKSFLNKVANAVDNVIDDSPFDGYTDIEFADGFFGSGYVIASFPSLYDMFGKFVAGLDIEALYTQILDHSIDNIAIQESISEHAIELEDDIVENAHPRFATGMRDINAVLSSSYIIGKALMETARTKALSRYSSELRKAMIPIATQRWVTHLEWNKGVIHLYAEIMKMYFSAAMDLTDFNYQMAAKNKLWPFTVLEYNRAAVGALQGAMTSKSDVAGASQTAKAVGGAMSGAAAGLMATGGNPIGGVVGGLFGLATAFF